MEINNRNNLISVLVSFIYCYFKKKKNYNNKNSKINNITNYYYFFILLSAEIGLLMGKIRKKKSHLTNWISSLHNNN